MRFLGAASLALAVLMIGLSSIQTELSRQSLYSLSTAFWSEFRRLLADTHAPPGEILRRLSGFERYRELDFVSGTLQLLPEHRFQEAYRLALEQSQVRSLELYPLLCQAGEIPGTVSLEHQLEQLDALLARMREITAPTSSASIRPSGSGTVSASLGHCLSLFFSFREDSEL